MTGAFAGAGQGGGWAGFALAVAALLIAHSLPARPSFRMWLTGMMGTRAYLALYSAVSLLTLGWALLEVTQAPYVPLLPFAIWQSWIPALAMPAAILLAAYGVAAANPLSIAGRPGGFDPDAPGIAGLTRHPVPWAFAVWAGAHALANPDLAHVLLFGGLAAFALIGMGALDARLRRRLGQAEWARLAARTSLVPGWALVTGRWRPRLAPSPRRAAIAVAVWAALVTLHPLVFGASPWPVLPR